jgi:hypothetical protein
LFGDFWYRFFFHVFDFSLLHIDIRKVKYRVEFYSEKIFLHFYLGPIAIDQVDPQGNFIVIENAGSTGKDQELKGWTLRRKIDAKEDIVYKFPDNFVLKSRSRIRILSRNASKGSINEKETLVAEGIQSWGTGTVMVTRLVDANGEEKALFNQKFQ